MSQVRNQLASIGVVVDKGDLLQNAIDGIPSSWEIFLVALNDHVSRNSETGADTACSSTLYDTSIEQKKHNIISFP